MNARAGYALPVVLAAVAVLSLVLLSAASAMAGLAVSARGAVDGAAFQAEAMGAEARTLLLVSTNPFAPDGLQVGAPPPRAGAPALRSALRLDGRAYAPGGAPDLRVSLQDEAGLFNLDAARADALLRLFARLGLSATEAETLRDRLLDALDADTDRRPRGAEPADYAARGLRAPRPGGFEGLAEVNAVMDWPTLMAGDRRRALEGWATAAPGASGFNVNTAPVPVLAAVLALADADARRIVAAREARPVTSGAQVGLPAAGAGTAEPVRPNGRVRLTVADVRRGLVYTSRIAPGLDAAGPPWTASSALVERRAVEAAPTDAPALPDPTRPPPVG